LTIPAVWQTLRDGTRVDRDASWVLEGDTLRVVPEDWDPSVPGVIDPTLDWSTYLGGGHGGDGHDRFAAIAIDAAGNAFVTGSTDSFDFPTTSGAFDTTLEGAGPDAFVAKVDPTGGALVFSTILGGSGDDSGDDVAVDATGNVYVVANAGDGVTDWPTTAGAYDTTANGGIDAAVTKLDPTGGPVSRSTAQAARPSPGTPSMPPPITRPPRGPTTPHTTAPTTCSSPDWTPPAAPSSTAP
jgi:hypothetical protein